MQSGSGENITQILVAWDQDRHRFLVDGDVLMSESVDEILLRHQGHSGHELVRVLVKDLTRSFELLQSLTMAPLQASEAMATLVRDQVRNFHGLQNITERLIPSGAISQISALLKLGSELDPETRQWCDRLGLYRDLYGHRIYPA